jgi:hypothetical protein
VRTGKEKRTQSRYERERSGAGEEAEATVMMNAPYKDRIEFWKLQHASITFNEVKQLCEFILKEGIDSGHPLHVPLMAALHTLYGRPFKQRKELRIAEDLVPKNYRDDHDVLINMRDKIHAHTDADGPKTTEDDCLNKVIVAVRDGSARFALTMVGPRAIQIEKIRNLAGTLSQTTWSQAENIFKKYFKGEFVKDGDYEVNISKGEDVFLKPSSW